MHKLLSLQLKKCFGKEWEQRAFPAEVQKLIDLVDQSYTQYDEDYRMLERTLDVNSAELTSILEEAQKQHEILRSVTESMDEMIFYKDLDFRYIGCNRRCAGFFGKTPADFIGRDDFELYPEEYATHFREMDRLMLAEMAPRTNTEWVKNAGGEDVLLLTTKAPLKNARGQVFGLVGIARDITREHRMEQEIVSQQALLIQQSRLAAMGEMIGNIAHQWRQPLNTLGLIVQDIEEACLHGEIDFDYIRKSRRNGMEQIRFMSRTIDDFRNFFTPNREKRWFSLFRSVQDTLQILERGIADQRIALRVGVDEAIRMYGYRNEFTQVLFNLLKNALDAFEEMPRRKDGWIEIVAEMREGEIEIRVSDNAGGIAEAIREKIFDPYFTTKEEGKGTGIGLYMSRMIVETMEGSLRAEPNAAGSTFVITLPAFPEGSK